MNTQKGSAHVIIITGFVVLLAGAIGFIFWQNFVSVDSDKSPEVSKSNDAPVGSNANSDVKDNKEVKTGTVSGDAIYPSERYPSDFRVCAISETTKAEIACDTTIESGAYSIDLTPGSHLIVARTGSINGYYDGYMKSGMSNKLCDVSNHTPLALNVVAGTNLENIDAGNFYYNVETPGECS